MYFDGIVLYFMKIFSNYCLNLLQIDSEWSSFVRAGITGDKACFIYKIRSEWPQ